MKRSLVYLILSLFILAAIISAYYSKDAYEVLPINTALNEEPMLKESWFNYDAPGGQFKVSLPLLPQTATQNLTDPKTDQIKHYEMYVAQTDAGNIYMISLINLPDELDENANLLILNQIMNDMVAANPGNKLEKSKTGKYHELTSLDFTIQNDQTTIEAKEFVKGKTIYLLSTISKKDNKEKTHFNYFVNSFKLNP